MLEDKPLTDILEALAFLSLVLGVPLCGLLLWMADRARRRGFRVVGATGVVLALVGLSLSTLFLLVMAFQIGLNGGSPLASISLLGLIVVVPACVLLVRQLAAGTQVNDWGETTYGITWPARWLVCSPLLCLLGGTAVPMLLVGLGGYQWVRWRAFQRGRLFGALAALTSAGRPLSENVFPSQTGEFGWKRHVANFVANLESGLTPSEAVEQSRVVSSRDVQLLRAAELSGTLGQELPSLARASEQRRIRVAGRVAPSQYLLAIFCATFALLSFVMYWIVPKFKTVFDDFDVKLPESFLSLVSFCDVLVVSGSASVLAVFVACAVAFLASILSATGPLSLPTAFLHFGPKRWSTPVVLRALAIIVRAGRSPVEPLKQLADRAASSYWQTRWGALAEALASGQPIADVLRTTGDVSRQQATTFAGLTQSSASPEGGTYSTEESLALLLETFADGTDQRIRDRFAILNYLLLTVLFGMSVLLTLWFGFAMFDALVTLTDGFGRTIS